MIAVLVVIAIFFSSPLGLVLALVCGTVFFGGLATISIQILREQGREPPSD